MGKDKLKGTKHSLAMKGKPAWNRGKRGWQPWMNISGLKSAWTKVWNKGLTGVITAWNKGKPNYSFRGPKNPNWRGGVTKKNERIRKSIRYKKWRNAVFKRDNYTCTMCNK